MAGPWLSIIGVGEDGPAGLTSASRDALATAEIIFGAPRHLELAGRAGQEWPLPFRWTPVLAQRGQTGGRSSPRAIRSGMASAARWRPHLTPDEWRVFPAPSTFSLAAARLGWRLEEVLCLGLHAAPLTRLRPLLARGQRIICLLRDGAAVGELAVVSDRSRLWCLDLACAASLGWPARNHFSIAARNL